MKKSKNKKTIKKKFIDEVSRFSTYEEFKVGDVVVYKRYSDKKKSAGEIKWFCKSEKGMCASILDLNLGNFQLGLCFDIEGEAPQSLIKSFIRKKSAEKKSKKI